MPDEIEPPAPKAINYTGNSIKGQKPEQSVERVVKPIASGVEKKRSLGHKFRETFAGDDAQTVGQYLLFDVVIPATKNLIFDMLSEGARRILFGGSGGPSRTGMVASVVGSRTSYNKMYTGGSSVSSAPVASKTRATMDFKDIYLQDRGEAEMVIDALSAMIDEYGSATVADLYALVNITGDYTATKWGWTSMGGAKPHYTRDGYMLDLPRATALE